MKRILCLVLGLFLCGCTISTGLEGPAFDGKTSGPAHVVATHAVLTRKDRDLFFDHTKKLFKELKGNPQFLGGSIRRKVLGDEAWTLTVWRSEKAMKEFFYSRGHLDAMYMASSALKKMRSVSFVMEDPSSVTWEMVLKKIEPRPFRSFSP